MKLRSLAIILAVLLATGYFIEVETGLYWHYSWLDIPFHFMGGAVVALFFWSILEQRALREPFAVGLLVLVGLVALVGILWEFFEWALDHTLIRQGWRQATVNDTLGDLLMDLLGALAAAIFLLTQTRKADTLT